MGCDAMSLAVGKYFHPREMVCRDGTPYPEQWEERWAVLLDALDTIREAFGGPLSVYSGYRSPAHNVELTKLSSEVAKASQHVLGRAADLKPVKRNLSVGDIHRLHDVVNTLIREGKLPAVGGVGIYPVVRDKRSKLLFPGFVHVDCRPKVNLRIARWSGEDFGAETVA